MNTEIMNPILSTIGGGFFVGILIGYALKKVVKIVAIVVGLFFAGLAYLQYQQIVNIDWNKLQPFSQNAAMTVLNATKYIPRFSNVSGHTTNVTISTFGIPLTTSMAMGFAIGFMRG
ncbi:MAG: FUN14 domain-containing protein [Thermoproteota archaeon]|nr:FUN14 domain-containing protein [Thermoproteota archaeon]